MGNEIPIVPRPSEEERDPYIREKLKELERNKELFDKLFPQYKDKERELKHGN